MADKTPSDDVPAVPIPPIVDLAGSGAAPEEKTVARPRKKAEPKVVPPAVPPVEAAPAAATPAPETPAAPPVAPPVAEAAPAAPVNPYAQSNPAAPANPYAQPAAAAAPGAPQPYAYGPYVPQPPKGLSITSMVLGLVGILFCGTLFPASLAAVITGHLAVKRQPYAKGFWLTGIISGYAGILAGLFWLVVTLIPILIGIGSYNYY